MGTNRVSKEKKGLASKSLTYSNMPVDDTVR